MSDQTALSFAGKDARAEGVAVVFAEEGPKLTPSAKDFDKKSGGLLSRAAGITGFKGKRESSVDLIAPQGLGFARVVVAGLGKPGSYSAEDWVNLGGTVRGLLSGREAATAHAFLDRNGGAIGAEEAANFSLGLLLRGYKFEKYKTKAPKKSAIRRASPTKERPYAEEDRGSCDDPKAAKRAFAASRAILDGVTLARDLVNASADVLGPVEFAARAKELTKLGVQVRCLGLTCSSASAWNALLGVGQGSERRATSSSCNGRARRARLASRSPSSARA